MKLAEMRGAIDEARATFNRADAASTDMARILIGRLNKVESAWVLRKLKKELQKFNMHTGTWKD